MTNKTGASLRLEPLTGALTDLSVENTPLGLAGAELPFGAVSFRVTGVEPGGKADVLLELPDAAGITTYMRYGPEASDSAPHWYDFSWDAQTGAELRADGVIVLHFVDGQRGDDDLAVNGVVVDAGGPATTDNKPPTPKVDWGYARDSPMQVMLEGTKSTDPEGAELSYVWELPDGRMIQGPHASYTALDGPAGHLRRFVLHVFDGEIWSSTVVWIAVPPPMKPECKATWSDEDAKRNRETDFDGNTHYFPWSTNPGHNNALGDEDEATIWFTWDPGDGSGPKRGAQNGIHQNDADGHHTYDTSANAPTHYTAKLTIGTYVPGTRQEVELATCETEVQFSIPVVEITGELKLKILSHSERDRSATGDWKDTFDTEVNATIQVSLKSTAEDPNRFVNSAGPQFVGSTYESERVVNNVSERATAQDGCLESSQVTTFYGEGPISPNPADQTPPPDPGSEMPSSIEAYYLPDYQRFSVVAYLHEDLTGDEYGCHHAANGFTTFLESFNCAYGSDADLFLPGAIGTVEKVDDHVTFLNMNCEQTVDNFGVTQTTTVLGELTWRNP